MATFALNLLTDKTPSQPDASYLNIGARSAAYSSNLENTGFAAALAEKQTKLPIRLLLYAKSRAG